MSNKIAPFIYRVRPIEERMSPEELAEFRGQQEQAERDQKRLMNGFVGEIVKSMEISDDDELLTITFESGSIFKINGEYPGLSLDNAPQ